MKNYERIFPLNDEEKKEYPNDDFDEYIRVANEEY